MTTIPIFDDKAVQIGEWAVEFCELLARDTTRENVNQAAVALRRSLACLADKTEQALFEEAYQACEALEKWKDEFSAITRDAHDEFFKLRAVAWWTSIKLQAKRTGW